MKASLIVSVCALLVCASVATAGIIPESWSCDNDHDGVINSVQTGWNYDAESDAYNLSIAGDHLLWKSGHMLMDFATDTPGDPTINSINSITNDTAVD